MFLLFNSILKTKWRQGKLPTVKRGFYGEKLTQSNLSLEHLRPHSKGGKTSLDNLVLASKEKNGLRGNESIKEYAEPETVLDYLSQFIGVRIKDFNGDKYVEGVIRTLKKLGFDFG